MTFLEGNFWNYIFDVHHIIEYGGLFLILAKIYIETGLFPGFVMPGGDYMLFATGIFCGTHYHDIQIFWHSGALSPFIDNLRKINIKSSKYEDE